MMFKKSLVAAVACLAMAPALRAQQTTDSVYTVEVRDADKYRVETNRFGANWFIGIGAGAQMYFGDHDKQMRFVDRLTPNFEVYFGKWFTPGLGIRLGANGYKIKGVSGWTGHSLAHPNVNYKNYAGYIVDWNPATQKGKLYQHTPASVGYPLYETEQEYIHAHADVLFNLTQLVCGYNEDRVYSLIPYAGLGFATSLKRASVSGEHSHEVSANIGILNRFRINRAWDINFDVRGAFFNDHFDQEDASLTPQGKIALTAGRWGEGLLTATLGVSYNIPRRGWDRSTITTIRVNENVLNDLRNRLGDLENQNNDLRRQLEEALNREVTPENVVSAIPLLVTFPINRWTLSNKDRVNLGFLADALKANPKLVYQITGFADKGTGSKKRNIFLARKRAEVVYNCLVKEFGVSESQLQKDSKGGVANMYYNDPRCSRSVLSKMAE
ncbi:OmpA family protein [uncultured Porphyromonas sp.]|uniref:OmpA family protein n=1 Tax=uncultured Porphyromonas sp. TaxID=159274 RepID=UPI002611C0FA|nr:OmpA family protein [uncultured Porphyromonas sp.]